MDDLDWAIKEVEIAKAALGTAISDLALGEEYLKELKQQRLTLKGEPVVISLAEYRSIVEGIALMVDNIAILKELVDMNKKTLKKAEEKLRGLQKQVKSPNIPVKQDTTGKVLGFNNDKAGDNPKKD